MFRSRFALPFALCLAVGVLVFSPVVGSAGIVLNPATVDLPCGPGATSPWSFEVTGTWDFSLTPNSPVSFVDSDNWSFELTPAGPVSVFGSSFYALEATGRHITAPAPHPGEISPSPDFSGVLVFQATPNAIFTTSNTVLHGSHADTWKLSALVNPTGSAASITVQAFHPVPEPTSLALLGVGSLIGLGVYTRRRRKNA